MTAHVTSSSGVARPGTAGDAPIPAARQLAGVTRQGRYTVVRLPPALARQAVERWLAIHRASGVVFEGPRAATVECPALREDQWAIRAIETVIPLRLAPSAGSGTTGAMVYVFPRHTVMVANRAETYLLRSLEEVKPLETDALGRLLPWVPLQRPVEMLGGEVTREGDAVAVESEAAIPAADAVPGVDPAPEGAVILDAEIHAAFAGLARSLGFPTVPPLVLRRGRQERRGFVTGRVYVTRDHRPLRVVLTTCPNSDWAEILATAVHELAHPLSGTSGHGDEFKRTLVDLAARHWGESWFAGARAVVGETYATVDRWVTAGIRAALRESDPPAVREVEDEQLARVLSRIRKLQELGRDQAGKPEGIAATAAANDLVTLYRLEDHGISVESGLGDQWVDAWIPFPDDARWRRTLAHAVAEYFGVFALASTRSGQMHLFGRHADLVTTEYLNVVSAAHIERACEAHLDRWRAAQAIRRAGDTRTERFSFCDSAAIEFAAKLRRLAQAAGTPMEGGAPGPEGRLDAAEAFAASQFGLRGLSWVSGRRRTYRDNEAGRAAGRSLEITRGVSSSGGPQGLIGG